MSGSTHSLSPVPPDQDQRNNSSMDSLITSDSSEDILEAVSEDELFDTTPAKQEAGAAAVAAGSKEPASTSGKEGAVRKKRKSRERKISISADHSKRIAGIKVRIWGYYRVMVQCLSVH